MADAEHVIERRARILSQKMQHRADLIRDFIAPEGQRPPFTKMLQNDQALKWWSAHRYDHLGARVLQTMRPGDIADLDVALMRGMEQAGDQGQVMA
jgi:hypothetical protein